MMDENGIQMGGGETDPSKSTSDSALKSSDSKSKEKKNATSYGSGGCGLWLDNELLHGRTTSCSAFKNLPLTSNSEDQFQSAIVEVYSLH